MNSVIINIKPKDIQRLLGLSYSQAKRKVKAIREINGKEKHQCVTVDETADYLGITPELIKENLQKNQ